MLEVMQGINMSSAPHRWLIRVCRPLISW